MEKQYKPVPDCEALKYKGTPDKPDIKIFVSHRIDQDSVTVDNPLYIPVRCGAVYDEREGITMLGDDTGDNISEKRNSFCELTVQYWAWKNIEADYYGLCHYRRFLTFVNCGMPETNDTNKTGLIYMPTLDMAKTHGKIDDPSAIREALKKTDVLALEPYDLSLTGISSIYDCWERDVVNYDSNVMVKTLEIIQSEFPDMLKYAKKYFHNSMAFSYNLFIMDRTHFNKYCEFLFGVLFQLEKSINYQHYNREKQRIIGYMGEHLLGVYLTKLMAEDEQVQFLKGIYVEEMVPTEPIKPAFSKRNNVVVFSSSDYFCPYFGVAVESLLDNISHDQNYDIIVLEKGISEQNKRKLLSIVERNKNVSLRFCNVKNLVCKTKFYIPQDNKELSEETYYTILVPWVLSNYDKALVLDCDILINHDISELYNIDLGNNYLAATKEYLFHAFLNNPFINVDESLTKYCTDELLLEDAYDYFQAGVLLINLKRFRADFRMENLLEQISENEFRIVEQDLLNKICRNYVHELDYRWNYMACLSNETIPQIALVSADQMDLYESLKDKVCIYHYITQKKPWKYPELEFADLWWNCAKTTPYYEILLCRMMDNSASNSTRRLESAVYDLQVKAGFFDFRSGARRLADKILPKGTRRREFAKKLLPKGSLRWRFCKQIYYIFKPQYRPQK